MSGSCCSTVSRPDNVQVSVLEPSCGRKHSNRVLTDFGSLAGFAGASQLCDVLIHAGPEVSLSVAQSACGSNSRAEILGCMVDTEIAYVRDAVSVGQSTVVELIAVPDCVMVWPFLSRAEMEAPVSTRKLVPELKSLRNRQHFFRRLERALKVAFPCVCSELPMAETSTVCQFRGGRAPTPRPTPRTAAGTSTLVYALVLTLLVVQARQEFGEQVGQEVLGRGSDGDGAGAGLRSLR
ncbi:hypothetical protein AAG570_011506 [Ranatra chinensis]|uniref:Uncharacterized protein n=1 Tax=Ranatra chinensis TaxID=642074 RepID=A0ABD0YKV7_9HEMI